MLCWHSPPPLQSAPVKGGRRGKGRGKVREEIEREGRDGGGGGEQWGTETET